MKFVPEDTTTNPIVFSNTHVDPDPDGLEFVVAFIADASINYAAAWLTVSEDSSFLAPSIGATLGDS